jgi:SAM-dependent methyltransferase
MEDELGQRERRLVFGEDAARYDRARPSYPAALIDDLVGWVGADARVIDVGCGTGKGTRLLAGRGMTGVGVEPHPAMAAVARSSLAEHPGWRVDIADFEAWIPSAGDAPADLVAAAQSWHWVDPSAGLRKAHGLLRPGGWLALWWNLSDDDPSEVRQEIDAVYSDHGDAQVGGPRLDRTGSSPFDSRPDDPRFDPDPGYPTFEEPVRRVYRWTRTYSTAELIDLQGTHSDHRLMAPDEVERLLAAVAAVVDRHGGTYDHRYACLLWAAQRR